jgi:hypothetical protein
MVAEVGCEVMNLVEICKTAPELHNIMHNLQLRYYDSNMFRPCSGYLQGAHISYMYKNKFCVNKLG